MFVNSSAGINKLGIISAAFPVVRVDTLGGADTALRGAGTEVAPSHITRCFLSLHNPDMKNAVSSRPTGLQPAEVRRHLSEAVPRASWAGWQGRAGEGSPSS